jgi:hypothetical protein
MTYPILAVHEATKDAAAAQDAKTPKDARGGLCALVVMAKAPRAGSVKTRLSPPLTPDEAAALNVCFLRDTTENLAAVAGGAGLISYTPAGDEEAFEDLLPQEFALVLQRGDGFGERLLRAAEDILALGFGAVCLIDSDSPTVPQAAFAQAVAELARPGDRVVLGPSDDGGYYLIGLKQPHAALFERITWSTAAVCAETSERAHEAGLAVVELPRWYDVDDAATLAMLEAELLDGVRPPFAAGDGSAALDGYAAPHTRKFLATRALAVTPQ